MAVTARSAMAARASSRADWVFIGGRDEPRARRATDGLLLSASAVGLLLVSVAAFPEPRLTSLADTFLTVWPDVLDGLWQAVADLLVLLALGLVVAAALTRRVAAHPRHAPLGRRGGGGLDGRLEVDPRHLARPVPPRPGRAAAAVPGGPSRLSGRCRARGVAAPDVAGPPRLPVGRWPRGPGCGSAGCHDHAGCRRRPAARSRRGGCGAPRLRVERRTTGARARAPGPRGDRGRQPRPATPPTARRPASLVVELKVPKRRSCSWS